MPATNHTRSLAVAIAVAVGLSIATTSVFAQDEVDSLKIMQKKRTKSTRSLHVAGYRERGVEALVTVIRARGVRNPLFVVDGRVIDGPLPQYVNSYNIECVEFKPGRAATLEFQRGQRDRVKDGVLIVWTRGSKGNKPSGCVVPY
ncbi:MAG: hypothetical protein ACE5HT_01960 [Gemmatimonadales bacterium]